MASAKLNVLCLSALVLSACSGSDGGSSTAASGSAASTSPPPATAPTPVVNESLGGIWKTQYTVTSGPNNGDTINALALVTEQGDFVTVSKNANNGCASIGFGQGSTSGSTASGTADWALITYTTTNGISTNCAEADGSTSGTTVLTGTVAQRATLTLTGTDTTSAGTVEPSATITFTYDSLYGLTPSLTLIAGNYSDGSDTLTVSANGAIFEQDPNNGCVINGQVSIPSASYNAYSFTLNYASCTGNDAALNGTTSTGLAYYDNTVTPNQFDVSFHGTAGGKSYVIVESLPKQ
jgi:hypothetical protein